MIGGDLVKPRDADRLAKPTARQDTPDRTRLRSIRDLLEILTGSLPSGAPCWAIPKHWLVQPILT